MTRTILRLHIILLLGIGLVLPVFAGEEKSDKVTKSKTFTKSLPVSSGDNFYIELRSADITISGQNSDKISLTAKVEVGSRDEKLLEEFLEHLEINLESYRNGSRLTMTDPYDFESKSGQGRGVSNFFRKLFGDNKNGISMSTNIKITLPLKQSLTLETRYGDVSVENLTGDFDINNRSGEVLFENCSGKLEIENRYARTGVTNFNGPVTINNSSGEVSLNNITGSADVTNSYKPVDFSQISGTLVISGQSSEISGKEVGSDCEITTSYKNVEISDVKGKLNIKGKSSGLKVSNVSGSAIIESSYKPIQIKNVGGSLNINGNSCSVLAENITGDVDITNSYKYVVLKNSSGSINILGKSSPIEVTEIAGIPDGGQIKLITSYKPITLFLPAEVDVSVSAYSKYGKIESDYPVYLQNQEKSGTRVKIGDGRIQVILETDQNITLRKK